MNVTSGGPLNALISYYERLRSDPSVPPVAEFGFSREKIHFAVVLEVDGRLAEPPLVDLRERAGRGRVVPTTLLVPDGGGRSGTGMKPYFCWDNTGYALGRDNKDRPARAAEMFRAFRDYHLGFRDELADDEGFAALCRFLEAWDPARAESLPGWEEAAGGNVVFQIRGREGYVHDSAAVRSAWSRRVADPSGAEPAPTAVSLVSGQEEPIARLHPMIGGVAGAQTTGAALVSFNQPAFLSYGKTQSFNAPVGVLDAFRYTTALNRLLADPARRARIGDATVVFWSDRPTAADAEDAFQLFFAEERPTDDPAEHQATVDRLRGFLDAARRGLLGNLLKDPDAPFYVLGLSPNASRLNVRYWMAGTVRQFAERLAEHADQLEIVGGRPDDPPPLIRRLVAETAREPKDIAPLLAGQVARAVLGGLPYPQAFLGAIIRRVRADATMNHRRASILKAYLIRNHERKVPVALNKDHPDEAYQLGRLFAALEKTQEDAADSKLNSTIKDRFFGAAAATPGIVFPRLLQLHQHHMRKLESEGQRIHREKLIGEICGRINRFPSHLALEHQGLFYIGYYHQRQDFFTKRSDSDKETNHD
ncbi:MAG: type I-C CRISPR-associated protein Cas8c/Csd1 [Isosphaeraceae bacterium]|nr:MAG: type I-C CRISPR-associated protein Cas8c/Csd1 [Isosphaeraceae bacterium]